MSQVVLMMSEQWGTKNSLPPGSFCRCTRHSQPFPSLCSVGNSPPSQVTWTWPPVGFHGPHVRSGKKVDVLVVVTMVSVVDVMVAVVKVLVTVVCVVTVLVVTDVAVEVVKVELVTLVVVTLVLVMLVVLLKELVVLVFEVDVTVIVVDVVAVVELVWEVVDDIDVVEVMVVEVTVVVLEVDVTVKVEVVLVALVVLVPVVEVTVDVTVVDVMEVVIVMLEVLLKVLVVDVAVVAVVVTEVPVKVNEVDVAVLVLVVSVVRVLVTVVAVAVIEVSVAVTEVEVLVIVVTVLVSEVAVAVVLVVTDVEVVVLVSDVTVEVLVMVAQLPPAPSVQACPATHDTPPQLQGYAEGPASICRPSVNAQERIGSPTFSVAVFSASTARSAVLALHTSVIQSCSIRSRPSSSGVTTASVSKLRMGNTAVASAGFPARQVDSAVARSKLLVWQTSRAVSPGTGMSGFLQTQIASYILPREHGKVWPVARLPHKTHWPLSDFAVTQTLPLSSQKSSQLFFLFSTA
mmetsp:Transcript_110762/g.264242  ORF Transcript_110762/g.264242 Transcript_110762/m.264242 type:complete len:516 (-) Transcript_110762:217-1764(-)